MDLPELTDDETLDALERFIRRADGFALAFARVNRPARRRALADDLRQRLDGDVRVVDVPVPPDTADLQYFLARVYEEVASDDAKTALFVTGIERVLSSARERTGFLPVLNFKRENLQRTVLAPVVLWLPEFALRHVALGAPDVWAWRSGVFEFASEREETDRDWEALQELGTEDEYARMMPDERRARIETLEALYADYEPHAGDSATALIRADLANRLARLYSYAPDIDAAVDWGRKALQQHESLLGPNHLKTLASVATLGYLLRLCGELDAAEPLLSRAVAGHEAALGPTHPLALRSATNLSGLLFDREEFDKAEKLLSSILAGYEEALGPRHPESLRAANNLAYLMLARGDFDGAEPLFRRSAAGLAEALGPHHRSTLVSITNLAKSLYFRGDLDGAEPLLREAVAGFVNAIGPDHMDTLVASSLLGSLLQARGDLDAAEPLHRQALESAEQVLGPNHPDTQHFRENLDALLAERDA